MATAHEFFHLVARPTAEEFLSAPTDIRRGFLAAIVLFHVFDYWRHENAEVKLKDYYQFCPDLEIIRSVANASKHCVLTNEPYLLQKSDQITQKSFPGLFQSNFGRATFGEASEVKVTLDDGTVQGLKPIVKAVLAMWSERIPLNP